MGRTASIVAPATTGERFSEIDALRGFALYGILLANLPVWIGIPIVPERAAELMGSVDVRQFNAFFNGVLDGKFYTIFSALFGLGFSLQLERLEAPGANGGAIFLRRMAVLLIFGLIHICLIWSGDILMLYALLGFSLPLFRRAWRGRQLVSSDWIREALRVHVDEPVSEDIRHRILRGGYGYQWWVDEHAIPGGSIRMSYAQGNGGQKVFIVHEYELVVVTLSGTYGEATWVPEDLLLRIVAATR
jgi:hypothetical protein